MFAGFKCSPARCEASPELQRDVLLWNEMVAIFLPPNLQAAKEVNRLIILYFKHFFQIFSSTTGTANECLLSKQTRGTFSMPCGASLTACLGHGHDCGWNTQMGRLHGACCSMCIILFIIKPTLYVMDLRQKEIKSFSQEHAVSKLQSWSWDAGLCDLMVIKWSTTPHRQHAPGLVFEKPIEVGPEAQRPLWLRVCLQHRSGYLWFIFSSLFSSSV